MNNLFEAWEGLTLCLSAVREIAYCPAKVVDGVLCPESVRVNGVCYAGRNLADYQQLRDMAMAYQAIGKGGESQ